MGVRIIKKDNSSITFYFNTLLLKDSLLYGSNPHFFNDRVNPIKISDIRKIEILIAYRGKRNMNGSKNSKGNFPTGESVSKSNHFFGLALFEDL